MLSFPKLLSSVLESQPGFVPLYEPRNLGFGCCRMPEHSYVILLIELFCIIILEQRQMLKQRGPLPIQMELCSGLRMQEIKPNSQ